MLTLSFGFKKPQNGDKGSTWFPAMAANMQQLNDHTHNGANSAKIQSSGVTPVTQALVGAWVANGTGYRQLVTMPVGMSYDDFSISFKDTSTGEQFFLPVTKASGTTFYVYANINTLLLTAYYLS